jgi:hypothetical protein
MGALVLALAALLLVPAVASAKTRTIDVPKKFKALLVVARDKTDVPIVLEWVEDDVLYWIQADAGNGRQETKRLVGMANSALEHGAR